MLKRSDMPAWKALQAHASHIAPHHLRDLFQEGGETRFDQLSVSALDVLYDFSRQRVTPVPQTVTVPETSSPGMSLAPGGGGYLPSRCIRSGRLTPAAATRTTTSCGPGCGTGNSTG